MSQTKEKSSPPMETELKQNGSERQSHPRPQPVKTVLRFSPTAWAKLLYFRDRGPTEIGGFAITAADDLLRVEEVVTVRQEVSLASIAFADEAVADFFEAQVDAGRRPEQFARIWLHTHPGESPEPSSVDEETFQRVFGRCQWAVMFVLARSGKTSARLRFNVGPGGHVLLPVEVDFSVPFPASNAQAWDDEYKANINCSIQTPMFGGGNTLELEEGVKALSVPPDWRAELEAMDPQERRQVLADLAGDFDLSAFEEASYGYW